MSSVTSRYSSLTAITSLIASLMVIAAPAQAADPFPTKPIRIIVGTAPGGSADVVARILAQKLQQPERLGQSVVVENKPGGALLIGMAAVANAAPDGYTIGMVANSYATMEDLYKNLPLKESDLKPVILLGTVPSLFLVQGDAPYNNVADFMKYAKEHPGKLNFGSAGIGTLTYLLPFALFVQNGLDMVHVPFPGAGPSMTALLGKQIDALFDAMTTGAQTVEGKQTKALATTGATRSARFPDLPTLIEQGYPIQGNTWLGIMAPKDVPQPIIEKLNAEINIVLQDPDVKKRLGVLELEIVGGSPEKFGEYVGAEKKFWGKVVRDAGLKLDN
jgi:tripartite-type tricarboxylate transporter receptor subunit TctC